MNTVKRAVIMAAGEGRRMLPVTLHTPKPLVRVNGVRMIDSVIKALRQNKIQEIYIVVGYLKEQFAVLEQEYPEITLIENPDYKSCNNISSLYAAREHLEEAMILDGDQLIFEPAVLHREFERSGYNCIWTSEPTKEWLLSLRNGIVCGCSRNGGREGWQLYSVSRWTKQDGKKLKKYLEQEFVVNGNKQLYWDDVALFCHPEEFQLGITEMKRGDIVEIDDLEELAAIDCNYQKYLKEVE
ncbi:MAG: phosphocholine cytidylyltransferase family protein [Lachnospiraceae bacterium]|nr:phosphocholine cytidylyltransferase family protein [Lachnospiraceae bacterium]